MITSPRKDLSLFGRNLFLFFKILSLSVLCKSSIWGKYTMGKFGSDMIRGHNFSKSFEVNILLIIKYGDSTFNSMKICDLEVYNGT
jgi:hypothetical protein